jgi:hypothetical protein
MSKSKVAEKSASKKPAAEPRDVYLLDGHELDSITDQLKNLTHVVIEAWATRDDVADGLENVLVKLHAARRNLESAVQAEVTP